MKSQNIFSCYDKTCNAGKNEGSAVLDLATNK